MFLFCLTGTGIRHGLVSSGHCATLEDMLEWVWDPEIEMKGWVLGGRRDLLPENEDDGQDIEPEVL